MTDLDETRRKIERLRTLRRLLIDSHRADHTAGVRPHKTDLIKQVEKQIAWQEHMLLDGTVPGRVGDA